MRASWPKPARISSLATVCLDGADGSGCSALIVVQWPYKLHLDTWTFLHESAQVFTPPSRPYDLLDLFAGQGAISRAFNAKGFHVAMMDTERDARDEPCLDLANTLLLQHPRATSAKDICSASGFARTLWAAMSCRPGCLACAGIPCSSWVTINSIFAIDSMQQHPARVIGLLSTKWAPASAAGSRQWAVTFLTLDRPICLSQE